jgi:hypothetical protein
VVKDQPGQVEHHQVAVHMRCKLCHQVNQELVDIQKHTVGQSLQPFLVAIEQFAKIDAAKLGLFIEQLEQTRHGNRQLRLGILLLAGHADQLRRLAFVEVLHCGYIQCFLTGEVMVYRGLGDTRVAGNLAHRHAAETAVGKKLG